jgi:hypothetical protein
MAGVIGVQTWSFGIEVQVLSNLKRISFVVYLALLIEAQAFTFKLQKQFPLRHWCHGEYATTQAALSDLDAGETLSVCYIDQ